MMPACDKNFTEILRMGCLLTLWAAFKNCSLHRTLLLSLGDACYSKEVVLLSGGSCHFEVHPLTDLTCGVPKLGWPLEDLNPDPNKRSCIYVVSYNKIFQSLPQTMPWSLGRNCLISSRQMTNLEDAHKPFPEVRRSSTAAKHTHLSGIHTLTQTKTCHLCTCTKTD